MHRIHRSFVLSVLFLLVPLNLLWAQQAEPSKNTKQIKRIPRVLLLIVEQNVGEASSSWWTAPPSDKSDKGENPQQNQQVPPGASPNQPMPPGAMPQPNGTGDPNQPPPGFPPPAPTGGLITTSLGLVENHFADAFLHTGFEVIDHQVLSGKITIDAPLRIPSPNNQQAAQIGELFDADFVLIGKAVATTTGNIADVQIVSAHATTSVRVVAVKTAEIIASGSEDGTGVHSNNQVAGSKALKASAEKLADKLIKAINSRPGIKAFVFD